MCLVCSYESLAGQPKVPYFDIIDAVWADADEDVVRLEITVDNVQAVERRELAVLQNQLRNENTYLCTWTRPCSI